MKYAVITKDVEKYLNQIIRLGDMNRNRLGLLPKEAFRQFAAQNTIYCIIEDNKVVAYVLFRVRKRSNIIVLTHLCVDSCNRNMGYAKKLVDAVQEQFPNIRCIEVRCRRDYNLEEFWKACGFHVIDERAGRKKSGSTLTIWHRDVNQYDLLYLLHQEETQNKLLVTLDTNILIDLFQSGPISDYLFDDYLEDYVAYRITPEVMDEVNRNKNDQTRKRTLDFCKRFQSVIIKDGFDQLVYELSSQFDTNNNHTRDIRHLELTDSLEERIGGNDSKQIRAALLAIAHRDPLQLEKTLSPLLIKGLDIPTYVIPVKPDYAAKLFDEELLSQTYLDNPYQDASLSIENSYFTASKCRFLCQCRIVWYG